MSTDMPLPWAAIDEIYDRVCAHNLAHFKPAVEKIIGAIRPTDLDSLYPVAVFWTKSFLNKASGTEDLQKRKILTDLILSRGTSSIQAQNARDSIWIDPAS